jgi:hypothetical protein
MGKLFVTVISRQLLTVFQDAFARFWISEEPREQGDAGGYAATGLSSTSRSMSGYQRLKI